MKKPGSVDTGTVSQLQPTRISCICGSSLGGSMIMLKVVYFFPPHSPLRVHRGKHIFPYDFSRIQPGAVGAHGFFDAECSNISQHQKVIRLSPAQK
jgi:hypothetical protein